jgi:hypothetical protein
MDLTYTLQNLDHGNATNKHRAATVGNRESQKVLRFSGRQTAFQTAQSFTGHDNAVKVLAQMETLRTNETFGH